MTRPEVKAGPIERILSPLNVGVDIGSRGVGDASGVGDGLAVAVGDGDGDAGGLGGSCATTRSDSRNSIESRDNAHEDIDIDNFLLVVNRDGACLQDYRIRHDLHVHLEKSCKSCETDLNLNAC